MKVDFMILGAQKCATSTFFSILNTHPMLEGCRRKEPQFFCSTKDWKAELPAYEALYHQKEGVLYFEGSTSYTFYPILNLNIWDDLYEYNPELKFIYIVRNPVDRIVSSYMHSYERGFTDMDFHEALVKDRFYIDATRYFTQIIPFIRKFGRERVLIIEFEAFNRSREQVLREVARFLGVGFEGFSGFDEVRKNVSLGGHKKHHKWDAALIHYKVIRKFFPGWWERITKNSRRAFHEKPKLRETHKQVIRNMLELEIDKLQELMGKDLQHWKRD